MNIYIYSDESGVFDKEHNDYFVFGGLIFLGIEDKENWSRKYSSVEKILRANKEKGKLFRTLNGCIYHNKNHTCFLLAYITN